MRLLAIEAGDRDASREELLEREILQIADREKQRFGRELHDVLRSQPLAGSAALTAALSRSLAAGAQPGPVAAADEIVRLNETIGEARHLAHDLSLIGLGGVGLAGGLETLAHNLDAPRLLHVRMGSPLSPASTRDGNAPPTDRPENDAKRIFTRPRRTKRDQPGAGRWLRTVDASTTLASDCPKIIGRRSWAAHDRISGPRDRNFKVSVVRFCGRRTWFW